MLFFLQWNFFFSKLLPRYFAPKTLFNIELLFSSFDGAGEEKNLILLRRQKHAERERERATEYNGKTDKERSLQRMETTDRERSLNRI